MLLKSSKGWLDKDANHDSVIRRRSSVCCSGCTHYMQNQKGVISITKHFQVFSVCSIVGKVI